MSKRELLEFLAGTQAPAECWHMCATNKHILVKHPADDGQCDNIDTQIMRGDLICLDWGCQDIAHRRNMRLEDVL